MKSALLESKILLFMIVVFTSPAGAGSPEVTPTIEGVTKIVFEGDVHHGDGTGSVKRIKVTRPEHIKQLVGSLNLVPKKRCNCLHDWKVTFIRAEGNITASICDHCFNLSGSGVSGSFSMPPAFYRMFCSLTGQSQPRSQKRGRPCQE